jgi:hypothetical protein
MYSGSAFYGAADKSHRMGCRIPFNYLRMVIYLTSVLKKILGDSVNNIEIRDT